MLALAAWALLAPALAAGEKLQWRRPGRAKPAPARVQPAAQVEKSLPPAARAAQGENRTTLRLISATARKQRKLRYVRPVNASGGSNAPASGDAVRPLLIQAVQQEPMPMSTDRLPPPRQPETPPPFDPGLLAQGGKFEQKCYGRNELERPLAEVTLDIDEPRGLLPTDCPLFEDEYLGRSWPELVFHWKASSLCHKPLYFEEVALERYGHSHGPVVQPLISGAHFFANIITLPYQMGLRHPNECVYPLGYYRPGSCAPKLLYPVPISLRGALYEGGVATGLVFLLP